MNASQLEISMAWHGRDSMVWCACIHAIRRKRGMEWNGMAGVQKRMDKVECEGVHLPGSLVTVHAVTLSACQNIEYMLLH